eukprot:gene8718-33942_t
MFTATAILLVSRSGNSFPGESFGTAMKACYTAPGTTSCVPWPANKELVVFEHTFPTQLAATAVMNHFWCGGNWKGYENNILRYYVDGEKEASVAFPFGLGHGSTMVDNDGPWSAGSVFGKTGEPSGIFNTYVVPFSTSITVTVELVGPTNNAMETTTADTKRFWIILRGHRLISDSSSSLAAIPLPGSGMTIPSSARLKTVTNSNLGLKPGGQMTLFNSTSKGCGAVFLVVLAVNSAGGPTFLEGCFRTYLSGGTTPAMLLSSGTEDYFLGTYYFNKGKYANSLAGLTHLDETGSTTFSAYRLHTDDPLTWYDQPSGMAETWRNSDVSGCDLSQVPGGPAVSASSVTFYYEWPTPTPMPAPSV